MQVTPPAGVAELIGQLRHLDITLTYDLCRDAPRDRAWLPTATPRVLPGLAPLSGHFL